MNYRDHWATDESGNNFIFTIEMQRQLHEAGLPVEPSSLSSLHSNQSVQSYYSNQSNGHTNGHVSYTHNEIEDLGTDVSGYSENGTHAEEEDDFEEPATIQIDPQSGKYIGRVKWYNITKGYGFISRGAGEDIFFHKTDVVENPKELEKGIWILYDVEETPKGLEASDVEIYESQMSLT
ncbi:MAG: cold shock domain-containing protein [Chloroflexota bacterium]